jgi:hypothetical protein
MDFNRVYLVPRRKAGRPNLRWLDCIENDFEIDGCQEMEDET